MLDALENAPRDDAKLREALRLAARRRATQWTGKKPLVDVLVVRV